MTSILDDKILYSLGSSPLQGPSVFFTLVLIGALIGCFVIYRQRQRTHTLQPEARFVLLITAGCLSLTLVMALISILPDILRPSIVERGRVIKVYAQIIDPESGPITRVALSNGADMIIPDLLGNKLVLGACVELTHTPATNNLLTAKQLAPTDCISANNQ
jgi:hypothetical protein